MVRDRRLNVRLPLRGVCSVEPLRRLVKRRNLNCLCQLLGSLGGGERLDHGAELIAQKDAVVGGVETDTVVGHAVLRLVISTNLLGTVAVANLALALGTELCLLLLELHFVEAGTQHLHADLAVLDLGALLLRLHNGVGGQVSDAYGGVGGVNALTTRARSAVGVDAQVGLVDLDVDLLGLGKHGDGCRGGLDTALGRGGRRTRTS